MATWPLLNWKELDLWVRSARPELTDLHVDRVVVPERSRFAEGYLKSEWAIRLNSRRKEGVLHFHLRPRVAGLSFAEGKGPKAATQGTQSAFGLALAKHLKGAKLLELEALNRERAVVLWFSDSEDATARLGLVLILIPALPEGLLVRARKAQKSWKILARTRTLKNPESQFTPPDGTQAPDDLKVREELVREPFAIARAQELALEHQAFEARKLAAERALRDAIKHARDRLKQNEVSVREARAEPDWLHYGSLLKAVLEEPPALEKDGTRNVFDFEKQEYVRVPCDPKLGAKAQVEKFFQLARRKQRREQEALARIATFTEAAVERERWLKSPLKSLDWPTLEKLERAAGLELRVLPTGAAQEKRKGGGWLGKVFHSREGLAIWVGRSKDENLELTFKHARGNDLWMHVKGRPSAHVLIPLPSNKSASLETLLDAASVCLHYSGGADWGKTEIDYTFKKYVKRIRDSTEASYTNNKTLIIAPDPERRKRLGLT